MRQRARYTFRYSTKIENRISKAKRIANQNHKSDIINHKF
jgi:hypothetical protein